MLPTELERWPSVDELGAVTRHYLVAAPTSPATGFEANPTDMYF